MQIIVHNGHCPNKCSAAWNLTTGSSSIDVAVVDVAVETGHPDLIGNMEPGFDVADNDNNPNPPNSTFNHGTHVAGIVAAKTNNGIGISSIGWNIDIIPVKTEGDNGSSSSISFGYEGITCGAKWG
ncbi:MAG: S8 family serine peptidase [Bacteroidetes bacterium]|nr:S8 family serine peptidase [Bacteroidota bacterium]